MEKPRRRQLITALASGLMCATVLSQIPKPAFASAPTHVTETTDYIEFPTLSSFTPSTGRLGSEYDAGGVITNLVYSQDNTNLRYLRTEQSASYVIFIDTTDSNKIKARNGTTGKIDYSGTDAATIINYAITALTNGGRVLIKAGTYTINSTTTTYINVNRNNIEFCGEGNATHLQLQNNAGTSESQGFVVYVTGNHCTIHSIQIDGNASNQNSDNQYATGIYGYNCSDLRVYDCYVHDNVTYGIAFGPVTDGLVENCYIQNSWANGIIFYESTRCSAINNIIDTASDVGISLSGPSGVDYAAVGNQIYNMTLGKSPFSQNTGIGIDAGDNGTVNHVVIADNVIDTALFGVVSSSGSGTNIDVIIKGNNIYNTGKSGSYNNQTIYCINTNGLIISGNVCDTFTGAVNAVGIAIQSCDSPQILNNYFTDFGTSGNTAHVISIVSSPNALISNNSFRANWGYPIDVGSGSTYATVNGNTITDFQQGIWIQANYAVVSNNTLLKSASDPYGQGIYVDGNIINVNVIGNLIDMAKSGIDAIYFNGSNNNSTASNNIIQNVGSSVGITLTSGSDNIINNNQLVTGTINDGGTNTHIYGNMGYNPINKISSMFNTSNNTIGTNGSTATPSASTDYVVQGSDLLVTVSGGSGVSITIKDGAGNTVQSGLTTITQMLLPYGFKINLGGFSSPPTILVFGL
jgi:hypothetical protein